MILPKGSNFLEAEEVLQFVIDLMDRVQFPLDEEQIDAAIGVSLPCHEYYGVFIYDWET